MVWRNAVVAVWSAPKFRAECNGRRNQGSHGDYFRARFTFLHFGWISGHKIFWPDPLIKKECRSWIMSHDASWIILHHWWSISWILHDHESLWITNDYAWWSMMDDTWWISRWHSFLIKGVFWKQGQTENSHIAISLQSSFTFHKKSYRFPSISFSCSAMFYYLPFS